MAEQNRVNAQRDPVRAGSWGNLNVAHKQLSLKGYANGDKVDFFLLPKGTKTVDFFMVKEGNGGAGSTLQMGLKAENGVGTYDSAGYYCAASALDAAARVSQLAASVPKLLDDDNYFVQGVIGGAGIGANSCKVDVVVLHTFHGNL